MHLRLYTLSDRATCLELFRSNLPDLFGPKEIDDFCAHLDALPGPYFLLEHDDGEAVACGGFCRDARPHRARLNWGIVGRPWHRLGYARLLLYARLGRLIVTYPDVERVDTHVSHYVATFFESAGFLVDHVTDDGYAPGLNRYDVYLELTPAARERVARHLAEISRQTGYRE